MKCKCTGKCESFYNLCGLREIFAISAVKAFTAKCAKDSQSSQRKLLPKQGSISRGTEGGDSVICDVLCGEKLLTAEIAKFAEENLEVGVGKDFTLIHTSVTTLCDEKLLTAKIAKGSRSSQRK